MITILLAGGQSKRMKPIEDKCFVKICGKYLIEWQLMSLRKAGFNQVVIVGNRFNLPRLQQLEMEGMALQVVEQTDLDGGMKAAMLAAKPYVQDQPQMMVVSSNDVVESKLWQQVQATLQERQDIHGLLVGYRVKRYFPGGYLQVNEEGLVSTIVEKPGAGNEPSDLVNLVVHVHRDISGFYQALEAAVSENDDLYEQALQQLFTNQWRYLVVPYEGFWQPVKYPWHLLRLKDFFLHRLERQISRLVEIPGTAIINGPVVIEEGVTIYDYAVVNGPAYIPAGCVLGNFSMVRGSSLGENCVVGSYTEIARSLLQDGVWTHKNYVGDSVIGANVSFGSGTVTGNLRLDEGEVQVPVGDTKVPSGMNKVGLITGDNIRVGINTSFMPGVKIGSDSMVGAHLFVAQDIQPKSYVKRGSGGELDIRENTKEIGTR